MKKIILLSFFFGLLLSCDPKPEVEIDKGQLDPNAKIVLRPDKSVKTRSVIGGSPKLPTLMYSFTVYLLKHFQLHQ